MKIIRHIPNAITCCNLISGCLGVMSALKGNLDAAALFIIISAVFDFFDGFAARLLKVSSNIGKELDSLADVVSFGVAPGMIIYTWMTRCLYQIPPHLINNLTELLPLIALLVPALSAVRLAKFNLDERQSTEFIGLPTPANAMFLGFLPIAAKSVVFLNNFWVLWGLTILFSFLLVSNISMISLKFKNYKWKGNEAKYIIILVAVVLLPFFKLGAFPLIILAYLLISLTIHTIKKLQII